MSPESLRYQFCLLAGVTFTPESQPARLQSAGSFSRIWGSQGENVVPETQ